MNLGLGLRILGKIMNWTEDEAMREFRWLLFMSAYKYDNYRDFLAGYRFIESLANWLQQFALVEERRVAYDFVRNDLIYFSSAEIRHLVEQFFPEYVQPDLIRAVSGRLEIAPYEVWSSEASIDLYMRERRRTLFMGLSDGARIDTLRRMNVGSISNEQFVIATQIDVQKWQSLVEDLQEDLSDENAVFSRLYLIDDFTASGTSLLRAPNGETELKGKLKKFALSLGSASDNLSDKGINIFEGDFEIRVHHYIATEKAVDNIEKVYSEFSSDLDQLGLRNLKFTWGVVLPKEICITGETDHAFRSICEKYYDEAVHNGGIHGAESGVVSKMYGYAECGTPIVLEHNTPNNSLPLLWADTDGFQLDEDKPMRPLFRRRERHSDMEREKNGDKEGEVNE